MPGLLSPADRAKGANPRWAPWSSPQDHGRSNLQNLQHTSRRACDCMNGRVDVCPSQLFQQCSSRTVKTVRQCLQNLPKGCKLSNAIKLVIASILLRPPCNRLVLYVHTHD